MHGSIIDFSNLFIMLLSELNMLFLGFEVRLEVSNQKIMILSLSVLGCS